MMDHRDYFGNKIKQGDLICWPNRQGSSMWMNHGYVVGLGFKESTFNNRLPLPVLQVKRVQVTALDNRPTGRYRNVEIECLERVVALGRVLEFFPKQQKEERDTIRLSWLDRVIQWLRSKV